MAYTPAAYNPAAYLPIATGPPQFQLPSQGANDIQLEIVLRSNLLQRQQKRIEVLESALTETCTEIANLKSNAQDIETRVAKDLTGPGSAGSGEGGGGSGDKNHKSSQSRYWTTEEHNHFLQGLERYGTRDFKAIAQVVGSRNATQVLTHAQKYFLRQGELSGTDFGRSDEGATNMDLDDMLAAP